MRSSQTAESREEFEAAEGERIRRIRDGLQFASVRHALRFLFERAPSMQAALPHHPRGHKAADGSAVYLQIDGGKGGDIHEVFATLQSIHDALEKLRFANPVQHQIIVLYVRDGVTMDEIARLAERSQSMVSADIGKAESFLLALLIEGGVVLPTPGRVSA